MTPGHSNVSGSLRAGPTGCVVRIDGTYATDAVDLWSALTEPERLARWLARVDGELRLGGEFDAHLIDNGERAVGRVVVCEPPRRLHLTWCTGDDEESVIAVELVTEGNRTRLVLEERGVPRDETAGYGAGWQAHAEALGAHLAGVQPPDWATRWAELLPVYRDRAKELP